MPIGYLYIFFAEVSIQVFGPLYKFFFCVCLFVILSNELLKILDIRFLPDRGFSDIFTYSVGCLVTFLIMSFDIQMV